MQYIVDKEISAVRFDNIDLSSILYVGCTFNNATFIHCDLQNTIFFGCKFYNVAFKNIVFGCNEKLKNNIISFKWNAFIDCELEKTNFLECKFFERFRFNNVKLYDSFFKNSTFKKSSLLLTHFEKVNFSNVNMERCYSFKVTFNDCCENECTFDLKA